MKLAIPIIIGQLGGIITGLADTIMVGQYGTNELAASSFVNNMLNMGILGIWFAYPIGFLFSVTLLALLARKLMSGKA